MSYVIPGMTGVVWCGVVCVVDIVSYVIPGMMGVVWCGVVWCEVLTL